MFDLIANKLTPEQQVIANQFKEFTFRNPIRQSGAHHLKVDSWRDALGDQLITISNSQWFALVLMTYHYARAIYQMNKEGVDSLPEDHPQRYILVMMKRLTNSIKKHNGEWHSNAGFVVTPYIVEGLMSVLTTMFMPVNEQAFDSLYEDFAHEAFKASRNIDAGRIGIPRDVLQIPLGSKDDLRHSGRKIVRFCYLNPLGFAIH